MKRDVIRGLLETFASANGIPLSKVTDGYAGFLCKHLSDFYDTIIINVIDDLTGHWDKRSMPQPKVLYDLCYEEANGQRTNQNRSEQQHQDKNEHKAWLTRKFRHRRALKELSLSLRSGSLLTAPQKEALLMISPYMSPLWGEGWSKRVDYQDEKQRLSPVTASFVGIYMDYLEEVLAPLTGIPKGNLVPGIPQTTT